MSFKPPHIAAVDVKRTFRYSVAALEFYLGEGDRESAPKIDMRADGLTIGCTVVTREAIEQLDYLFQKHYPKGKCNHETRIQ